jgi:hypothetical protein
MTNIYKLSIIKNIKEWINNMNISDVKLMNEVEIKQTIGRMESDMKSLVDRLNAELEQLQKCKEYNQEYKPNSLGVVQGQGNSIDNNCGKLGALYETKDLLKGLE